MEQNMHVVERNLRAPHFGLLLHISLLLSLIPSTHWLLIESPHITQRLMFTWHPKDSAADDRSQSIDRRIFGLHAIRFRVVVRPACEFESSVFCMRFVAALAACCEQHDRLGRYRYDESTCIDDCINRIYARTNGLTHSQFSSPELLPIIWNFSTILIEIMSKYSELFPMYSDAIHNAEHNLCSGKSKASIFIIWLAMLSVDIM